MRPFGFEKRAALQAILAALLALMLAAPVANAAPAPDQNRDLAADIIPGQQPSVLAETAGRLSAYRITAAFTPASTTTPASIAGMLDLRYLNATGVDQRAVYLRLYPNSAIYPAGGMSIGQLMVNGVAAAATLSVHGTVAAIGLPAPLKPLMAVDLSLSFRTEIPTDPRGTYGMYQFDSASGVYALANWFPILAGYDPVSGWLIAPPAVIGDPVFGNAALFDATLTAPAAFVLAAGGTETGSTTSGGQVAHHLVSGPARDLVIAISERFQTMSAAVGDTMVTSYFLPEHAAAGANALTFGARALQRCSDRYGVYPYRRFALVETPLGNGADGVEFPQLVFLGSRAYEGDPQSGALRLDFLIGHEVAHQWFYGLAGNDQYQHAFLDEGLATVAALLELNVFRGAGAAAFVMNAAVSGPYRSYLRDHRDLVVDTPSESFPSVLAYNAIVYGKATLGFEAIRSEIGAGLRRYVARFRFNVAQPNDLLACFNDASGQDLSAIWSHWFEEAHGSEDGVATPAATALTPSPAPNVGRGEPTTSGVPLPVILSLSKDLLPPQPSSLPPQPSVLPPPAHGGGPGRGNLPKATFVVLPSPVTGEGLGKGVFARGQPSVKSPLPSSPPCAGAGARQGSPLPESGEGLGVRAARNGEMVR